MVWVRPGRLPTRANPLAVRVLMSDDLPTLERPASATSTLLCLGYPSGVVALVRKRASENGMGHASPPGAGSSCVLPDPDSSYGRVPWNEDRRLVNSLTGWLLRLHDVPERQLEHVVHMLDQLDVELAADVGRDLPQILLIFLGQEDRGDAGPVRCQHFLLDAAHGQDPPPEGDLAGHRHIAADGPLRQRGAQRDRDGDPSGRPLFGDGS